MSARGAARSWTGAVVAVLPLFLAIAVVHPQAFDLTVLENGALHAATALVLVAFAAGRKIWTRSLQGPLFWLGAAALWVLVRNLGSEIGWSTLLDTTGFLLLVMLAREVGWTDGAIVQRVLVVTGAVLGGLAVAQVAGWDPVYGDAGYRAAVATLGNTNAFAACAAPLFVIALARASSGPPRARWFELGAVVLLAAALVLARSRAGWIAGGLGGALVALRTWRGGSRPLPALSAAAAAVLAALLLAPGSGESAAKDDFLGLERSSNQVRAALLRATAELVGEKPLFGHGPGRFALEIPRFRESEEAATPSKGAATVITDPHDTWLHVAADGGLLLLGLMTVFAFGVARHAWRCQQADVDDDSGQRSAAWLGALAALFASSLFWSIPADPVSRALAALLCGLALASRWDAEPLRARRASWVAVPCTVLALALFPARASLSEWRSAEAVSEVIGRQPAFPTRADADRFLAELERAADLDRRSWQRQLHAAELHLAAAPRGAPDVEDRLHTAARLLDRSLALHPRLVPALDARIEIALRLRQDESARRLIRSRQPLVPVLDADLNAAFENALTSVGRQEDAFTKKLEEGGVADLDALLTEAKAALERGDAREAARMFDRLALAAPHLPEVHRQYAFALDELGFESDRNRERRLAQLGWAVENLRAHDYEMARNSLRLARRYGDGDGVDEALLEAAVSLLSGERTTALEQLGAIADGAARSAQPWVRDELRRLVVDAPLLAEFRRLGLDSSD